MQLIPTIVTNGPRPEIDCARRGWSMPWTIRQVERRVSPQRRRAADNRDTAGDGAPNRRRAERRATAPAPTSRVRVLVVEDNRLMRDSLARLLADYADVEIVASADNASTVTPLLREAKPQVVLLDAALAGGESFSVLTDLKTIAPEAKALIMNCVPTHQDVQQFIDGGANGFILTDATADDLVSAIRSVAAGFDLQPPPAPSGATARGTVRWRTRTSRRWRPNSGSIGGRPTAGRRRRCRWRR